MKQERTYSEDSRPNRILLDIRDRQPTGISRYAIGIARACTRNLGAEVSIGVLCESHQLPLLERTSVPSNVTLMTPARTERFVRFDDAILEQIVAFQPDHYHGFANFVDARIPCPWSVTIHDLIRLSPGLSSHYADGEFAAKYSETEYINLLSAVDWMDAALSAAGSRNANSMLTYLELMIQIAARRSAFILTPSASTKQALRERVGDEPQIHVDPPQPDPAFSSASGPSIPQHHEGDTPYLVFVGTPGKHKRLDVVESYLSDWGADLGPAPRLLAVGDRAGENIYERIDNPAARGKSVQRLGYVSDELLSSLYRSAVALVVPSVLEGYCLPADEALQSGGRVVASRIGVLTDRLTTDRVRFFNLSDSDEFLSAVVWALEDSRVAPSYTAAAADSGLHVPLLLTLLGHGEPV